ncbi:hypothetical protein LCGC14_0834030, partial [marine sediment metagenome]
MLDPNDAFQNALISDTLKLAELYDVALSNGTTYYYTSHSENIKWGDPSKIYISIPIQRQPITNNINLEMDTVQLSLQNISDDLYDLVQKNVLDSAIITIRRINWTDSYASDLETIMFVGTADIEFDRQILTLTCKSILNSLNVQIPRPLYQEPCNHVLFDEGCALTKSNFKYDGITNFGASDRFSIIDSDVQIFKVPFDAGSNVNPFTIGDAMTGDGAGVGICVHAKYTTLTTGNIWISSLAAQFVDDEVVSGPAGVSDIVINGTPHENTTFFEIGEVKITSGDNDGQRRMIRSAVSGILTVLTPFPNNINNNVTYEA